MVSVRLLIDEYLAAFPEERERLMALLELVRHSQGDDDLLSRHNFVGHVTGSGIVISRRTAKVLLLYHKTYHLHLQPGGHFVTGERSPLEAVHRIVRDETSIVAIEHVPFHFNHEVPIDIDTHQIPENKARGEPTHWHHDFRYVFLCDVAEGSVELRSDRFLNYKWVDINELLRMETYSRLAEKLRKALSAEFRPKIYFELVIERLGFAAEPVSNSIVVTHLLPDAEVYLRALDKVSPILAVIPKPRSVVPSVYEAVKRRFTIKDIDRQAVRTTDVVCELMALAEQKVVLFDIGGYFAPVLPRIVDSFSDKVIGVIEDTENGHQKYERLDILPVPVYSVARSPLKANEDFLVGQSILFSADSILRELGKLIQYAKCSILGVGKVGSSIAHHLLLRGAKPDVFDTDPMRRLEAYNRLYGTPPREEIIRESDVIFCATGSLSLNIHDFRLLKPGCVIFSVTSADDEMDLTYLEAEYRKAEVAPYVTRYSSFNNYFYLINKGNAVNFLHKAVVGEFIHLVRAEMIYSLHALLTRSLPGGMYELREDERRQLAAWWLAIFVDARLRPW